MAFLKQYIKKVKEHMKSRDASEDEIKEFETGVKSYVSSDTFKKFKYDFFTGESMDTDGMVVLLNYRADDTPYCVFCEFSSKPTNKASPNMLQGSTVCPR